MYCLYIYEIKMIAILSSFMVVTVEISGWFQITNQRVNYLGNFIRYLSNLIFSNKTIIIFDIMIFRSY